MKIDTNIQSLMRQNYLSETDIVFSGDIPRICTPADDAAGLAIFTRMESKKETIIEQQSRRIELLERKISLMEKKTQLERELFEIENELSNK